MKKWLEGIFERFRGNSGRNIAKLGIGQNPKEILAQIHEGSLGETVRGTPKEILEGIIRKEILVEF